MLKDLKHDVTKHGGVRRTKAQSGSFSEIFMLKTRFFKHGFWLADSIVALQSDARFENYF